MAAALEGGYWNPSSRFTVPDTFTTPNGQTFHDSHDHPVQRLTLTGVLAQSSNTGTVQVGRRSRSRPGRTSWRSSGSGSRRASVCRASR